MVGVMTNKLMIDFTDLNCLKHVIDPSKISHVQLRDLSNEGKMIFTFHLVGPHVIPVSVDKTTAARLMKELEQS